MLIYVKSRILKNNGDGISHFAPCRFLRSVANHAKVKPDFAFGYHMISGIYPNKAIQCISGALACIYSPVLLAYFQAKPSFIIAASIHIFYIAAYIYPNTIALYITSGFLGAAGSLIWMTHGITVIHNSNDKTLTRNYSLFFVIFQISFLASNRDLGDIGDISIFYNL